MFNIISLSEYLTDLLENEDEDKIDDWLVTPEPPTTLKLNPTTAYEYETTTFEIEETTVLTTEGTTTLTSTTSGRVYSYLKMF